MNTTTVSSDTLFCDYYKKWITVYKEGAIRPITMNKDKMAHQWLVKLIPTLLLGILTEYLYQKSSKRLCTKTMNDKQLWIFIIILNVQY
ncbi:MAG: hypothetical protein ACLRR3_00005 [Eubacterium sp.]